LEKITEGLKIIVDAGNGSGGFFAGKVLAPLGADFSGSQFLEPDGNFPNHVPNPEDSTAMTFICNAVKREKADLGIIFDTDVDRFAIVDASGQPINRNELIALISAVILEEHPGSVIVTDSITSAGLKWFIEEESGGIHHRFKRGYKNVINESIRLNKEGKESWLAIETSGHAALKENHFPDDETDPGGKKPVWYVYQAADKVNENEVFNPYKEVIGIKDWNEVNYLGEIDPSKKDQTYRNLKIHEWVATDALGRSLSPGYQLA
jgi:phosphomannomutase